MRGTILGTGRRGISLIKGMKERRTGAVGA